jgi:hypothetical protein
MRVHFDVLGWLHALWGVIGVLTGASLAIIAGGAVLSVGEISDATRAFVPTVILLIAGAAILGVGGVIMLAIGNGLRRRQSGGRHAALAVAVPTLLLIPFGTALGLYTFWTLLNDDARRAYGRPPRSPLLHD